MRALQNNRGIFGSNLISTVFLQGLSVVTFLLIASSSSSANDLRSAPSISPQKELSECRRQVALLGDAIGSGGKAYERALREQGYDIVLVNSFDREKVPEWAAGYETSEPTQSKPKYLREFFYDGDPHKIVNGLKADGISPAAGYAGADSAVIAINKINTLFGLPAHDEDLNEARRNKALTNKQLKAAGRPYIPDIAADNVAEVVDWMQKENINLPIVMKPQRDGGSKNFNVIFSLAELEAKLNELLDKPDSYGNINDKYLIQPFLGFKDKKTGDWIPYPEFFVEQITAQGQTVPLWIGQYTKIKLPNGARLNYIAEILPINTPFAKAILKKDTLDLKALGYQNGPSHNEHMSEYLIESNSRMGGAGLIKAGFAATGIDEPAWAIEAGKKDPSKLFALASAARGPHRKTYLVLIPNLRENAIFTNEMESTLRGLSSLVELEFSQKPGVKVKLTEDIDSILGHISISHDDPQVVERDLQLISKMIEDNRFTTPINPVKRRFAEMKNVVRDFLESTTESVDLTKAY